MIYFCDKETGHVVGYINGRIHSDAQLAMWIGNKEKTDRIVVDWKRTGKETETVKDVEEMVLDHEDAKGNKFFKKEVKQIKTVHKEWEPQHAQKALMIDLDKNPKKVFDYKFNAKTGKFVKK